MKVEIEPSWKEVLAGEFEQGYFKDLAGKVREAYLTSQVFPPPKLVFNAFNLCPFDKVKVVIIGQDPYHGPSQAHGLCFSVQDKVATPPSLKNIYKEIKNDLGKDIPQSGNLERWAKQGVLLLNATLTVRAGEAGSHQGWGWEQLTDAAIRKVSEEKKGMVFMLWGRFAQNKSVLIDESKHLILKAPHPSPLSAHNGWFGSGHFSKANDYLKSIGKEEIDW
ncbi:MAG: uracil-DNA glycosylase [Candidatus Paceibacterota bacterium]